MKKKHVSFVVLGVIVIFVLITAPQLFDTVKKGTYQVKQAAVTGTMSAKMTPGLWMQMFGDITKWPKAETFYFTQDLLEGEPVDQSIEVRFNDGSICHISGTLRVILPTTPEQAIDLVTDLGYQGYSDLERKLILPVTRNALRLTANFMTARESYAEKRPDYVFHAWDQIQNGLYQTEEKIQEIEDPISGKMMRKAVKVIKRDADGNPLYQKNPLEGTGITLQNFEIKVFAYDPKVQKQIATQQEAYMEVATARAQAEKAKQQAKTAEEEGKANVMKAKYEKEQEKIQAVVQAQKEREVAEIAAQQRLNVAELDKKAAEQIKQQQILLGEGEGARKRAVLMADGALQQKLDTYKDVMKIWADAHSQRKVPSIMIGGGPGGSPGSTTGENFDTDTWMFQRFLTIWAAKQLGLDLTVPEGAKVEKLQ